MRKCRKYRLLGCIAVLVIATALLNLEVTTKQGVNYKVRVLKVPLYLKLLDFFDRHYNYRNLVNKVVNKSDNGAERAIKLLRWTHDNIRRAPKELPIVDDHVWYAIVRGYGAKDQFSDTFTTLCNYAGIDAFYSKVSSADRTDEMIFSFVKIKDKWTIFDPYEGVFFKDLKGDLADISILKNGKYWSIEFLDGRNGIDYVKYFKNLPEIEKIGLKKANIQSPINRLIFELGNKQRKK